MEFAKLLDPYAEKDRDGKPARTIEGQIKWLTKKGLPRDIIDQAIMKVFNELESGKQFQDDEDTTGGHKLDHYILQTAQDIQQSHLSKQVKELEAFMGKFKEDAVKKYVEAQQESTWKRIKAVFKPGVLAE